MAHPVTTDTEFAAGVAQMIHDVQNGSLDRDKAKRLQVYLLAAPDNTVTAPIVAVQGNR